MTDRFSKAVEELQEKSPFVCVSCGHHEIPQVHEDGSTHVKDRFSDAVEESAEKSAFVCESCKSKTR